MSDHDLTHELCKSLDRHLAFPLLEFLSHRQLYDDADIQRAKIDLLQKTNMVDYAAEIYQGLYNTEDIPEEMNTRRKSSCGKAQDAAGILLTCTYVTAASFVGSGYQGLAAPVNKAVISVDQCELECTYLC